MDRVLGLDLFRHLSKETIPQDLKDLLAQREVARKSKNWKEADRIRAIIDSMGYVVEDASNGPRLKKN